MRYEPDAYMAFSDGYKAAIADALQFIDSLPEEEMKHIPQRILVKMIRIQIERLEYDPFADDTEAKNEF